MSKLDRRRHLGAMLGMALVCFACRESGSKVRSNNAVPLVSGFRPASAIAGSAGFTLTLLGANFVKSSTVSWGDQNRPMNYLSASELTIAVAATEIVRGGSIDVIVTNPAPGGGASPTTSFTVNNPLPTLSSMNPMSANAGDGTFTLTLYGSNFMASSFVHWGGQTLVPNYLSPGQLTAQIPSSFLTTPGTTKVTVTTPGPGGGTTAGQNFVVTGSSKLSCGVSNSGFNCSTTTTGGDFATMPSLQPIPAAYKPYAFQTAITIDNTAGSDLTDYQVAANFSGDNFDFSKANANGTDVAIVDSDHVTALSFWRESWDPSRKTGVLWVKVPSIPAGQTKTILMYSGNASVPDLSDGSGTFLLYDSMSADAVIRGRLRDAKQDSKGYVVLNPVSGGDGAVQYTMTDLGIELGEPVAVDFDFWSGTGNANSVWFYASDSRAPHSEEDASGGYHFIFDENNSQIALQFNGTSLNSIWNSTINTGAWHAASVSLVANLGSSSMDGIQYLHFQDTPRRPAGNLFGFGGRSGNASNEHRLRSVRFRKAAAKAPLVAVQKFPPWRSFFSVPFDLGHYANFSTLNWTAKGPPGTALGLQVRCGFSQADLQNSAWYGPTGTNDFYSSSGSTINSAACDGRRWMQIAAVLTLDSNGNAPVIESLSIGSTPVGPISINVNTQWPRDHYAFADVTVSNGATLTIAGGSAVHVAGTIKVTGPKSKILLQSTNRVIGDGGVGVTLEADNIQVDVGARISADGQGYPGGSSASGVGMGPGGGMSGGTGSGKAGGGGSYGGLGGNGRGNDAGLSTSGVLYGTDATGILAPTELGSGGGSTGDGLVVGQTGGGSIQLLVSGLLTNNGIISANGNGTGFTTWEGAGSGGSINIIAGTIAGTGSYQAKGGDDNFDSLNYGGGAGGGGRIAVSYASAPLTACGMLRYANVAGGVHTPTGATFAAAGSVRFVDRSRVYGPNADVIISCDTTWNESLHINSLVVQNGATLSIGGGTTLTVNRNTSITGTLQSLSTNRDYALGLSGQGTTLVTNGDLVLVDSTSRISADGQGYLPVHGPGAGYINGGGGKGGGGYGGQGGQGYGGRFGTTYGAASAPVDLGSGGGAYFVAGSANCGEAPAGAGGGAMQIVVGGLLTNSGTISANGEIARGRGAGGGSGGSLWIQAGSIAGAGSYEAKGGSANSAVSSNVDLGAGGGGGRMVMSWATADPNFVKPSAGAVAGGNLGSTYPGETGTFVSP